MSPINNFCVNGFNISLIGIKEPMYINCNLYFTAVFVKCWQNPEFIKILENMEVCTTLEYNDYLIFKN